MVLHHFSFRSAVHALVFSPTGRHFAAAVGRNVEVWLAPPSPESTDSVEFAPFVLYRSYGGHFDLVQAIEWSGDSRFFLTASKDLTARIWSLDPEDGFVPTTLAGHRQAVLGAWFSKDQESVGMDYVVFLP